MVTCFWDTVHVMRLLLENEFFDRAYTSCYHD